MSEIPEDILDTTNKLVNDYVNPHEPRPDFRPDLRRRIAAALTDERNRWSATPDLLESLEEVMEWISNWGVPFLEDEEWGATYDKVTAALSKARGR